MSDTTDNQILYNTINNPVFQDRCRLRFVNSAIAVTTEVGTTPSHANRLAFAGALFNGTVDLKMLAMLVLANGTNRINCLASPNTAGGSVIDNDIDFQVNSVFTGVAVSRSW